MTNGNPLLAIFVIFSLILACNAFTERQVGQSIYFPNALRLAENEAMKRQLLFRFGRTGNMRFQPFLLFG
ncbi:hypothetical protein QR680_015707 [Steinernema hermaphroditum]|uniref:Uncharacterized protein n=1 Tax=Steinernema hermaphroditum TaxID=289476 RepID=A0AA39H9P3_9BILA|nr:hypothetical protein QR680_015707 [Steinernema hermaphroditum]